ncbi:MetS family NSS transporter small subunit [Ornithinibacillus sp. L9]|uniref:MetS family NSS transporter small subunit n=1 Tax=Ornithinibacillus caprae TaxID=2678566 RepID=A0A6N8FKU4_9BACI|nr:MetS family NSS transporter small subunit [Ornithinibacillus caprae]MUK90003.1 MetS family NSS transporter small subunit [Ornithinibacillus caprae]
MGAIIVAVIGIVVIWGGLALSITRAVKVAKENKN